MVRNTQSNRNTVRRQLDESESSSSASHREVSPRRSGRNLDQPTPKSTRSRQNPPPQNSGQQARQNLTGAARRKGNNPPVKKTIDTQIKILQSSDRPQIPMAPFSRLVREVSQEFMVDIRYTKDALDCLRTSTEIYFVQLFEDAYRLSLHGKRKTLMTKDITLLLYLRGPKDPGASFL